MNADTDNSAQNYDLPFYFRDLKESEPEAFREMEILAQFHRDAKRMAKIYRFMPFRIDTFRVFHRAVESLPFYEWTVFQAMELLAENVEQQTLPETRDEWMEVLRALGWEDGELATAVENGEFRGLA